VETEAAYVRNLAVIIKVLSLSLSLSLSLPSPE
jgi:hypothetical protein